jgi:DNA-binding CsgD family transcriptional regulator/PAS domain-containing protein
VLPDKVALSKLLCALYDAAGDSSLWSVFLRELAHVTRGNQSGILLHDLKRGEHSVSLQWGIDPASARLYQEYYGTRDLWMQKATPHIYAGWLATSEEICPLEELVRSEFYNDYLQPNEMAHAMWGVIENSPARIINIGIYRDLRKRPFRGGDLNLLRFLAPHLDRAFRMHLQLSELKTRADNLQNAIDMVATGIILLGSNSRIIHMNHAAAKLLAEDNGLIALQGRLHAERTTETATLHNLIAQAQDTSRGKGVGPAGAISISRRTRPALQVLIAPVRNIHLDAACPVYAIAFVTDPSQKVRPTADILQTLYGLTPAECRVTLLLGDDYAPPAIAGLIGVSRNTLKTQLTNIYRKTGTSRQSQVVRLVVQLASTAPKR